MKQKSSPHEADLFADTVRQVTLALVCGVLYLFGFSFTTYPQLPMLMPVAGLVMATMLLNRKNDFTGLLIGVALAQIIFAPVNNLTAAILTAAACIEGKLGAWLLNKYKKFEINFEVSQSFLAVCLVSLFLPSLSVSLLAVGDWLNLIVLPSPVPNRLIQFWMGDSVVTILLTSLLLVWKTAPDNWKNSGRSLEIILFVACYFLVGQIIFFDWFHTIFGAINRGYWIYPLIIIAAVRIGRHGTIVLVALTVVQALSGALAGKGFFATDLQQTYLINLWNYSFALALVGITFSVILKSRQNTEDNLLKRKHQLKEAQKLAEIADWSWDVRTDERVWSEGMYAIYGRGPALGPSGKDESRQYFTAESWEKVISALQQCVEAGVPFECDAQTVRPDGSHCWITVRGEAVRNPHGEIINLFGTVQDITERKQAQLKVASSESNFRTLFENSPTAMLILDSLSGQILKVNENAERLWGYEEQAFLKMNMLDLTHPADILSSQFRLESFRTGELANSSRFEKRFVKKNGSLFWAETSVSVVRDEAGTPLYNIGSIIDITERKQIEQQLTQLSMTVEQSPESIVITDIHANIEYVNESYLRKSGYSREELIGQNSRILQSGSTPKSTFKAMWDALTRGQSWEGEFINRNKEGFEYTEHAIISPIRQADGCITHYVAVKEDITEKLRSKMQLHRLAYYDEVTELPNFLMMQEHVNQALAHTRKYSSFGALIILNIDRFKTINDANGQAISNKLLKAFGERLVQTLYSSDIVSRISGDEFCILLPELENSQNGAALLGNLVSKKMHACMAKSFHVGGKDVVLSACHGITIFSGTDDDNPHEIVRRASTAMHHAKSRGCEQSVFFEASLDLVVHNRFAIEGELRQAIGANELRLYLQSQVDAREVVQGAEALVRWEHPRRGLIGPFHFIGVAEESNLIVEIDNWVLNQVCRRLASLTDFPIRISVNVSARHFSQVDFVAQVCQTLALTGADPHRLTLEITEGVVIGNLDDVVAKMRELRALGIHFSMDDFGTGYSSLSYLKRLPIDELKIDKSFIQEVTTDANDAALVESILAVTRHLKLRVVAEGVETLEQAGFLNQRAEILHQGYLYSVPEPIESWLANYEAPQVSNYYK